MRKKSMSMVIVIAAVALLIYLATRKSQPASAVLNEETWRWIDWHNRPREITVTRRIHTE